MKELNEAFYYIGFIVFSIFFFIFYSIIANWYNFKDFFWFSLIFGFSIGSSILILEVIDFGLDLLGSE